MQCFSISNNYHAISNDERRQQQPNTAKRNQGVSRFVYADQAVSFCSISERAKLLHGAFIRSARN